MIKKLEFSRLSDTNYRAGDTGIIATHTHRDYED